MLTKINPVESGYFWGKSWYFNEKSRKKKPENLIYKIVSYLYIAISLFFRSLRYNLLTKNVYQISLMGSGYFGAKTDILIEKIAEKWKISDI